MINFPNIQNPAFPYEEEREDNSIATKFEDGSQQSRVKYTRSRRTFHLKWELLSDTDYHTLMNFVVNSAKFRAVAFNWVNPTDGETYEVRISEVGKWSNPVLNFWSGSLTLVEV